MGGFTFAKSKGKNTGSSFYVCLPCNLEGEVFNDDVVVATERQRHFPIDVKEQSKKEDEDHTNEGDDQPKKKILFAEVSFL